MNTTDPRLVEGMARQAQLREHALGEGARQIGWKAGFGTSAAMAKFGTTAPLAGFLTSTTQVLDGSNFSIDGFTSARLEAEVAVRLGSPIAPSATADEVLGAVEAVAPAIELVDLGPADDVETIVAGNIFHRAFLLGPFAPATPTTFLDTRVNVELDGETLHADVDPATQLGRLEDILIGMSWQLALAAGAGFSAGDVVITGWVVTPLELVGGEAVTVSLRTGAAVSVSIDRP